ncbi:MAG: HTH domain-containing protein [Candidatus Hadarchaeota archaeon]
MSSIRHGLSVQNALAWAANDINGVLANTPGRIARMDANIDFGISGATVRLTVAVDESDVGRKYIIWANEPGGNVQRALRRAQDKINVRLAKLHGEIVGFYQRFITPPLPKRIYATLILAVNERMPKKMDKVGLDERRERLAAVLQFLGNDPRTINLVQVAKTFGVSRDTIYKDLEDLGIKR